MSEKKVNVPQEIKDEELDVVAGGIFSTATWDTMSREEKTAAQNESLRLHSAGNAEKCKLTNDTVY